MPEPILDLSYRPVMFKDNPFIKKVFETALVRYQGLMSATFEGNVKNMDILTERGMTFHATGLEGYILQQGEIPIGFSALAVMACKKTYMAALYLLPEFQRLGLGSAILNLLEAEFAGRKATEMVLLAHTQADWAVNFYARNGYREITTDRDEILAYTGKEIEYLIEPGLVLMGKAL